MLQEYVLVFKLSWQKAKLLWGDVYPEHWAVVATKIGDASVKGPCFHPQDGVRLADDLLHLVEIQSLPFEQIQFAFSEVGPTVRLSIGGETDELGSVL